MSITRACAPCRVAKAKCNLHRPTCSRCARRGLVCTGWTPDEGGFFFLDENDTARRGSQRARRQRTRRSPMHWELGSASPSTSADRSDVDEESRKDFPWLSDSGITELSQPLKRSIETRAVERFFVDWTLNPCNHGASPGSMYMLPFLYEKSPHKSVLRLSLRALAFADHKDYQTPEGPLSFKARRCYGNALTSLREVAGNPDMWAQDEILSAILLLDDFEIMHLSRDVPLGPHREAIRHALRVRGDVQFMTSQGYSLWRAAHHRLLMHQLMFAEDPEPMQDIWLRRLNMDRPETRATSDVLKIARLNAAATKLTKGETKSEQPTCVARKLVRNIRELLKETAHWPDTLSKLWRGTAIDVQYMRKPEDFDMKDMPLNKSLYKEVINFHDIWISYVWSVHSAAQIVIREHLVVLLNFIATQEHQDLAEDDVRDIELQRAEIGRLSLSVIESLPPLLGYTPVDEVDEYGTRAGRMLGRFLAFLPLWVIKNSELVSERERNIAQSVTDWMKLHYGLD